jgi:hypothetical protein
MIPIVKAQIEDFDEDKLVYGFLSSCGRDGYTGYVSITYFYYLTDLSANRYIVFDVGTYVPQKDLKGQLDIELGCSQASYTVIRKEN